LNIVTKIRQDWQQTQFSPEDIEFVEGVIYVNGLELPTNEQGTFLKKCSLLLIESSFQILAAKQEHSIPLLHFAAMIALTTLSPKES
jgi:hypothetical protein